MLSYNQIGIMILVIFTVHLQSTITGYTVPQPSMFSAPQRELPKSKRLRNVITHLTGQTTTDYKKKTRLQRKTTRGRGRGRGMSQKNTSQKSPDHEVSVMFSVMIRYPCECIVSCMQIQHVTKKRRVDMSPSRKEKVSETMQSSSSSSSSSSSDNE